MRNGVKGGGSGKYKERERVGGKNYGKGYKEERRWRDGGGERVRKGVNNGKEGTG